MSNKNIYIFITAFFYGGFLTIIFRELFVLFYTSPLIISSLPIFWIIGTYTGFVFDKNSTINMENNLKNIILWIFLFITVILYFFKLSERIISSPSPITLFLLFFLIIFTPFILSLKIKLIIKSASEVRYPYNILFFGISLSPFLIYLLIRSGLNNWFIVMTLGILYIGILLIFIEKGKSRIISILFIVPIFAFFILANNNIIKKETTGFHPIKYFETETGQYFVADKNKRVYFIRNFKTVFKFPFKNKNFKTFLTETGMKFGDILILNNNPAIVNEFIRIGIFNIDYYIGEEKFYYEIAYDFPEIIRALLESNVKIFHGKFKTPVNKKYDLILLPKYNEHEIFSKYFHETDNLLYLSGKLKQYGKILSIGEKDKSPPPFFDKISKNIFILKKDKNIILKLMNLKNKNILKKLFILLLSIFLLITPLFILKKRGFNLLISPALLFLFTFFSLNIYIKNNFELYDNSPLIFTLFFIGVWSGYLILNDIIVSKFKITILLLIPFLLLALLLFYFNNTVFYSVQLLSGFLFTGLFLSLKVRN